jgi:hypothetical protein
MLYRILIATCLFFAAFETSRTQQLPTTIAEAQRMEAANVLHASALYASPVDLSRSKRGDLLGQKTVSEYALPLCGAVRILYHSTDGLGHEVTTSAVVLLPRARPPTSGWPVSRIGPRPDHDQIAPGAIELDSPAI